MRSGPELEIGVDPAADELEDHDVDEFPDGTDLLEGVEPLPVVQAAQLPRIEVANQWLVEGLWPERGVGIVGGEPKAFKTFIALEIAVAVASGAPALRKFAVSRPGPVFLHQAEDPPHVVRMRLDAITRVAGVDLGTIPLYVSTAQRLRLDLEDDRQALAARLATLQPRLVVLDPLIRLHRIDENAVQDVARILGYLREFERQIETAILVVHHAKKATSVRMRGGQALRGSSELHAWGDSTLYSRRVTEDRALLTVEHRAAPDARFLLSLKPCPDLHEGQVVLDVVEEGEAEAQEQTGQRPTLRELVLQVLRAAGEPMKARTLRERVRCRAAALSEVLRALTGEGLVSHDRRGYLVSDPDDAAADLVDLSDVGSMNTELSRKPQRGSARRTRRAPRPRH